VKHFATGNGPEKLWRECQEGKSGTISINKFNLKS
jgi:hypothetical protein